MTGPARTPWLTAALALALAGPAHAHASERMVILTLPTGPFLVGAGLAVLLGVVAGSLGGRLPGFGARRLADWPGEGVALSWLGFAALLGLLAAGTWGDRDPLENPLPLVLWLGIWVALVLASSVLGDLWRPIAPWRGPVRLVRRLLGRRGGIGLSRLGHWPAVLGLLAFSWFENVSLAPSDPWVLARVAGLYWLTIFLLAVAEGEDWLDRGEALTASFALFARVAPLWRDREDGRSVLKIGLPGAQIVAMPVLSAGEVGLVTLLITSVTFDGLSESFWWLGRIGINPLEFPGRSAVMGIHSLGLVVAWGLVTASILGAVALGGAGRTVLLSFLPISAGYHVAHYLVALLSQGQYGIAALNDPLGRGWALLGLPDHWASFGFLTDRGWVWAIWGTQFTLILGAHLLAVVLALKLAGRKLRAHLPVTVLMIGYTVLGLWLLATPTAG
ncbi:hypothetical protein [Frigidibacter sp. ROC022]|uniref:hypothetical protein n=1 Tax=Frigidibacter sp. ROC022 TaxID=2971796 RepID=UPI00215A2EC2|nr:hypothetical protein [Frigidibacter sp. ROC022]MCR8725011.1 hypothetical protein [Frigidibacter sp. ROC022]